MRQGSAHEPVAPRGDDPDADVRVQVLRAAVEVAQHRGYHGTTLERVAESAGLALDEVTRLWPDRVELLSAALELAWDDWHEQVPTFRSREPLPDLRAEIERRLTEGLSSGQRAAHFWRLGLLLRLEPSLVGSGCSDLFDDVRRRTLVALHDYWSRLLPPDADPRLVGLAVRGHLALADGAILAGQATPEWDLERMMSFVASGIAAVLEKGSIYVDGPLPPAPGPGQVSAAQPASAGPATEGAP